MVNQSILKSERATRIVADLRHLKLEVAKRDFVNFAEPYGDGDWTSLPGANTTDVQRRPFAEVIYNLDHVLAKEGFDVPPSEELNLGEFWSVGTVPFVAPIRTIHGGFLEPRLRVLLLDRLPDRVVAFLVSIPGDRDLLEREHHDHVGWHYHYLDHKRSRSDVVLCWDTRVPHRRSKEHPLFQEKHGRGHAKFTARPDLWGDNKRWSMHSACAPDLDTWPMSAFRCASKKAGPVWPRNTVLTPA